MLTASILFQTHMCALGNVQSSHLFHISICFRVSKFFFKHIGDLRWCLSLAAPLRLGMHGCASDNDLREHGSYETQPHAVRLWSLQCMRSSPLVTAVNVNVVSFSNLEETKKSNGKLASPKAIWAEVSCCAGGTFGSRIDPPNSMVATRRFEIGFQDFKSPCAWR